MKDLELKGYYEIWKEKFTPANLKKATGVRNTKAFKDSYQVDLIIQRSDDKHEYVRLYGKPTSKENIKIWETKKSLKPKK